MREMKWTDCYWPPASRRRSLRWTIEVYKRVERKEEEERKKEGKKEKKG
jgi:hypothetical protein